MVNGDGRQVERAGQRVGNTRTHQQRAAEAGALGVGNRRQVGQLAACFRQRLPNQRHGVAHMIP